jgi:DNA-binding winged helix-turn-helix (wHTH) protein
VQICFGPFVLDLDTRQLIRGGSEIHLSPKAFDLLALLAQARPAALSKTELQQRLWPDTFVAEANLSNLIAEIRDGLDDAARAPLYVRTVHRFGYAFSGQASAMPQPRQAPAAVLCWLEWGAERFPLGAGEHVIGRDAGVEVRIDASTVSRRHARLLVAADGAVLEDFGSKNGTFRGDARVAEPVRLEDGDLLRIGSQRIVFHLRGLESTETTEAMA